MCGYARIGGRAGGDRREPEAAISTDDGCRSGRWQGRRGTEFGGVIATESAQKAARFIMDCNQSLIPLIFLHDVNGFAGGEGCGVERHHSRRGEDGFGCVDFGGAEDHCDPRRKFWRRTLCDVRLQGLRVLAFCLRGRRRGTRSDEWSVSREHIGRRCGQGSRWNGRARWSTKRSARRCMTRSRRTYDAQADPRYRGGEVVD